ncbi:MAG: DUF169 domain-containing protein [Anaerolineae bacterium]|nr:DUF169 domain-containing protein [Anaerolineae bacterium]MCB9103736.1 DUF169 domain-containing protein [Anaerolineales bacterium]
MSNSQWNQLSQRLTKVLGLKYAPIAITFSQEAPAGVDTYEGVMPPPSADGRTGKVSAGCVFWIKAQDRTFTTVPQDHYNCSVGSVTHGLKSLPEVMNNEDVQGILECEWVTPEEAMQLPAVSQKPNYITYGPLATSPVEPDVILLRLNAFQSMVIHDGFSGMPIVGKPQCHIIPMSVEQNEVAMSTGCMLSRVRTGMGPDEMTCTIPADRLEEVVEKLEARQLANAAVSAYASQDMGRFAAA